MWKSTADDGVTKIYFYDENGNQNLTVTSDGNALPGANTWAGFTAAEQVFALIASPTTYTVGSGVAGMVWTMAAYDKRGQATETYEPSRQLAGNATSGYTTANITRKKVYNAFGEVIQEIDPRNATYITDYVYNTLGKVIERDLPAVNYTQDNGLVVTNVRPTEYYFYDASGRVVGVTDANGNSNWRTLLADTGYGGEEASVLKEFRPDGSIYTREYDAFGDMRRTTNELGAVETYTYDGMDRLLTQTHATRPSGSAGNGTGAAQTLVDTYTYDGLGHRLTHYNSFLGASVKETTDYDAQGRVVKTVDMGGSTTTYGYVWTVGLATTGFGTFGGWTKTTTNAGGVTATDKLDYFGRTVSHTDFATRVFSYTFDQAGRLLTRSGEWMETDYTYFNTGQFASIYSGPQPTGALNNQMGYRSIYQYDVAGNRTSEVADLVGWFSIFGGPLTTYYVPQKNTTVTWDAANRMTALSDTGATFTNYTVSPLSITWQYDLGGNIRRMTSVYRQLDAAGNVVATDTTQDYWYKYDTMNRFVITKGTFTGTAGSGSISRGAAGSDVSYDAAGQRATMTDAAEREVYTYTADGFLAQVKIGPSGSEVVRGIYEYDAMGRLTLHAEKDASGATVYSRTGIVYNAGSLVTDDVTTTVRTDGSFAATTHYDYKADSNADGDYIDAGDQYMDGLVTHSTTSTRVNGGSATLSETKSQFMWYDSAKIYLTWYTPDTAHPGTQYQSDYFFDPLGNITGASAWSDYLNNYGVSYITDTSGMIVEREVNKGTTGNAPRDIHYYFNGMAVGDVSNNGTSNVDYAVSIASHTAVPGTGLFRGGATTPTASADFDQSYDPINGLNYQSTSSRYTVSEGDTLQSIAYQLWGDASLWYLIADANGLAPGAQLAAGMSLAIPNKVHNVHNNTSTYRVYDPNTAIGDTSPIIPPAPPPKKHGGCGIIGQIILVIVAVVVAYFTVGAALSAMGVVGAGGATTTSALLAAASLPQAVAAGAIAGAAGSIVSQGVGLATGIQSKFDWKAVGMAAIGGGVTAGIGYIPGLGGTDFMSAFARGVVGNALTQGIGVATGLQSKFNWTGVATAGVAAGVSALVSNHIPGAGQSAKIDPSTGQVLAAVAPTQLNLAISGAAGMIAGAATRTLIDGSDFGDNILAGLPGLIGQTIGNAVAKQMQDSTTGTSAAPKTREITLPDGTVIEYTPPDALPSPLTLAAAPGSIMSPLGVPESRDTATQISHANAAGYSGAQIANALGQGLRFVPSDPTNPQQGGLWVDRSGSAVYAGEPAGTQSGQSDTISIQNGYGQSIASTGAPHEDISQGVPDAADDIFGRDTRLFPAGTSVAPVLLKFPDGNLYYNVSGTLYSYSWAAQSYLEATGQAPSYSEASFFFGDDRSGPSATGFVGETIMGLGLPTASKRFATDGASRRTSVISSFLRPPNTSPADMPRLWAPTLNRPLAMTAKSGRFFGRWIPVIGWGLVATDIANSDDPVRTAVGDIAGVVVGDCWWCPHRDRALAP